MKKQILTVLSTFFLFIGSCPAVFANEVDSREMAIDMAVGGMEEGSRPLSSGDHEDKIPGGGLSPGMDTRVTASAAGPSAPALSSSPDTSAPGGGTGQETVSETSGGTGDSNIVDVGADANLGGSPSVDADVTVDPNAGGGIVDADASLDTSAEGGLVDADASTTADVIDQELTSDAGLQIDRGDSTTLLESTLGNEIGTSTAPSDTEANAGLEADVEGAGSGEALNDEADGLSAAVL